MLQGIALVTISCHRVLGPLYTVYMNDCNPSIQERKMRTKINFLSLDKRVEVEEFTPIETQRNHFFSQEYLGNLAWISRIHPRLLERFVEKTFVLIFAPYTCTEDLRLCKSKVGQEGLCLRSHLPTTLAP